MNLNRIERSQFRLRRVAALVVGAALVFVFSGGASEKNFGTLGPGFFDPAAPPPPEGMIRPKPGSWDSVHPPRGYRVVLLTSGDDRPTATLVTAVKQWAHAEDVRLETIAVTEPRLFVDGIVDSVERRPDLVICAGHAL